MALMGVPPGLYLLTHQRGTGTLCIFAAIADAELTSEAGFSFL